MITRLRLGLLALIALLSFISTAHAASSEATRWITYVTPQGQTEYLLDNRKPALYTGNFGDCMGGSAINVTRFDAAYYQDNMTVLFHLAGETGLNNQSLMMYIGVFAYGESRFNLVFNPCHANIYSLCPTNASVPISAQGIIPVAPSDVSNIPDIAFSIPDFEGEAILRIFSNTTQEQIACYSAVVTNGNSFSQPASVGSVLGIFTFVAVLASFATAIYGESIPTMRLHYAHSLSVGVVFAVFQHIYFSGALSLNWPSVLVAWWSNFAWAGGMIYVQSMQYSIDHLIGNKIGNTSHVGAASSGSAQPASFGGGFHSSQIYGRSLWSSVRHLMDYSTVRDLATEIYERDYSLILKRDAISNAVERTLTHRLHARDDLANSSTGYNWYGKPVGPGLPLPGNYSGFAGTLSEENIPLSNAFMTGFLWFLVLLAAVIVAVPAFKGALEVLIAIHCLKKERLRFFRSHWLGYTGLAALRTCLIAFFMMMFLTMFQFSFVSNGAVQAIAVIVFLIFLIGLSGAAFYAVQYQKLIPGQAQPEGYQVEKKMLFGRVPWPVVSVKYADVESTTGATTLTKRPSFWKRMSTASIMGISEDLSVHDNDDFIKKFGWLFARFRRTRWWFFAYWLFYEFLRAIFYGAASGSPFAQVFALIIIEVAAWGFLIWAKPFEGQRLNIIVVWCLGFSKVATVTLSACFIVNFNIGRIITTAIGIIIIVIQGILTIITMIAIVVGAVSSYFSISRNQEDFRPHKWGPTREKYFDYLDRVVNDLPPPPKPKKEKPAPPPEPVYGFEITKVKRLAKIEDEDEKFVSEVQPDNHSIYGGVELERTSTSISRANPVGRDRPSSRAASISSVQSRSSLPYGARVHRPSWSTRDFSSMMDGDRIGSSSPPIDMTRTVPDDPPRAPSPALERPAPRVRSRRSSTHAPLSNKKLKQPASRDSLHMGSGGSIAASTIEDIPMPTTRPRADTLPRSLHRNSIGMASDIAGPSAGAETRPSSRRSSGLMSPVYPHMNPLTPAQEMEEWAVPIAAMTRPAEPRE